MSPDFIKIRQMFTYLTSSTTLGLEHSRCLELFVVDVHNVWLSDYSFIFTLIIHVTLKSTLRKNPYHHDVINNNALCLFAIGNWLCQPHWKLEAVMMPLMSTLKLPISICLKFHWSVMCQGSLFLAQFNAILDSTTFFNTDSY